MPITMFLFSIYIRHHSQIFPGDPKYELIVAIANIYRMLMDHTLF